MHGPFVNAEIARSLDRKGRKGVDATVFFMIERS
jgi:hypothetical protein